MSMRVTICLQPELQKVGLSTGMKCNWDMIRWILMSEFIIPRAVNSRVMQSCTWAACAIERGELFIPFIQTIYYNSKYKVEFKWFNISTKMTIYNHINGFL